jgi:hypothetical protein
MGKGISRKQIGEGEGWVSPPTRFPQGLKPAFHSGDHAGLKAHTTQNPRRAGVKARITLGPDSRHPAVLQSFNPSILPPPFNAAVSLLVPDLAGAGDWFAVLWK